MMSNVPSNRHASRPPLINAYAETARASFVALPFQDRSLNFRDGRCNRWVGRGAILCNG
jgi:hypothetical protein